MTALALVAVALLVAVNAVFVAVEFALLASSDVRLESDAEEGRHGAARAHRTTAAMATTSLPF